MVPQVTYIFWLDINNVNHIWLLHQLFLPTINQQLSFFAEAWNQHRIQNRGGPNRSPADMFGFDMFVHGIRGDQLAPDEENLPEEELEVYGVDWEGLQDERLLHSQLSNNSIDEGASSWIGRTGPPQNLGGVVLDPPSITGPTELIDLLDLQSLPWVGRVDDSDVYALWTHGLARARTVLGNLF